MDETMKQYKEFFEQLIGTKNSKVVLAKLKKVFSARVISLTKQHDFLKYILKDLHNVSMEERVEIIRTFITAFLAYELETMAPPEGRRTIVKALANLYKIPTVKKDETVNRMFG